MIHCPIVHKKLGTCNWSYLDFSSWEIFPLLFSLSLPFHPKVSRQISFVWRFKYSSNINCSKTYASSPTICSFVSGYSLIQQSSHPRTLHLLCVTPIIFPHWNFCPDPRAPHLSLHTDHFTLPVVCHSHGSLNLSSFLLFGFILIIVFPWSLKNWESQWKI